VGSDEALWTRQAPGRLCPLLVPSSGMGYCVTPPSAGQVHGLVRPSVLDARHLLLAGSGLHRDSNLNGPPYQLVARTRPRAGISGGEAVSQIRHLAGSGWGQGGCKCDVSRCLPSRLAMAPSCRRC